jgi:hypothetical protein
LEYFPNTQWVAGSITAHTCMNILFVLNLGLYSSSSSVHFSPLLDIDISNLSPRSIFDSSHPAPAIRPAQILTPPGLRASYTTFTETRSPLQNSFTPAVIGSSADMARPLPVQRANTACYVGDLARSFPPDYFVSDSIPQRNPEHTFFHSSVSDLELMDHMDYLCKFVQKNVYKVFVVRFPQ